MKYSKSNFSAFIVAVCLVLCFQGASAKSAYENKVAKDCVAEALNAVLQADGEPKPEISGFGISSLSCRFDGARVYYKKGKHTISFGFSVYEDNGLGKRVLDTIKMQIQILETHIEGFQKLEKQQPNAAKVLEKQAPPPLKEVSPTGNDLYIKRVICSKAEERCGSVEALALIGNKYIFKLTAEDNDASLSNQRATSLVREVVQSINWGGLR